MQTLKDRSTTSCTECQRRKQKCSREWPCNHCQTRKVPHLCQFGPKRAKPSPPTDAVPRERSDENAAEARGLKRNLDDERESSELEGDMVPGDHVNGLKMWGYMPGHMHYNLDHSSDADDSTPKESSAEAADQTDIALAAIPPRSITDAILNHFLQSVNYRYNAIYSPTFTQSYVQWWSDRTSGRRLSPDFTCLLLRVLSYSTQYLSASLRSMVEFELATTSQALTDRFAAAADQLIKSSPPSCTSVERVQNQFLKGAWLKSEGRIVESWHSLGCTIREAQELGIDKDSGIDELSEYDVEIRRRLWALLFVWDWQMSAWLNRPHLINQKDISFTLPNLRLDQSTTEPNLLSPFAHIALQAKLARRLAPLFADVHSTSDCSTAQIRQILAEIDHFIADLPPIFRVDATDHSFDSTHPYLIFQRLQLHAVLRMTSLNFVKPSLAHDPRKTHTPHDTSLRDTGITIALELLGVGHDMFDHEFPVNAKFHMVIFCIFDTATILCSAVIHDRELRTLPQRARVIDAIHTSIAMLRQLSRTTKIGAASYRFLFNLARSSPELCPPAATATEEQTAKRHRANGSGTAPVQAKPASASAVFSPADPVHDTIPIDPSLLPTTTTLPPPSSSSLPLPLPLQTPTTAPTTTTIPTSEGLPTTTTSMPFNLNNLALDLDLEHFMSQTAFPLPVIPTTTATSASNSSSLPAINGTVSGDSGGAALGALSDGLDGIGGISEAGGMELGGLEAIWDWEGLNLDFGGLSGAGSWLGSMGVDGGGVDAMGTTTAAAAAAEMRCGRSSSSF